MCLSFSFNTQEMREFRIQLFDEREGIKNVWRLDNFAESGWIHGQANIQAINQGVPYWVSVLYLRSEAEESGAKMSP